MEPFFIDELSLPTELVQLSFHHLNEQQLLYQLSYYFHPFQKFPILKYVNHQKLVLFLLLSANKHFLLLPSVILIFTFLAYILDISLEYIPFNSTPLFWLSNNARAKLKSLPVSLNALYLIIPIFCIHFFCSYCKFRQ
mgnify:CR=1 FL=1